MACLSAINYLDRYSTHEPLLERIQVAAAKARASHPHNLTNPFFTGLAEMQVSIDSLLEWLEDESRKRNIQVVKQHAPAFVKGIHILCRNERLLRSFITNFTFQAKPDELIENGLNPIRLFL